MYYASNCTEWALNGVSSDFGLSRATISFIPRLSLLFQVPSLHYTSLNRSFQWTQRTVHQSSCRLSLVPRLSLVCGEREPGDEASCRLNSSHEVQQAIKSGSSSKTHKVHYAGNCSFQWTQQTVQLAVDSTQVVGCSKLSGTVKSQVQEHKSPLRWQLLLNRSFQWTKQTVQLAVDSTQVMGCSLKPSGTAKSRAQEHKSLLCWQLFLNRSFQLDTTNGTASCRLNSSHGVH